METEKVCINLPAAELGKIDVLVAEGLFASRTDLIRNGIRLTLAAHEDTVHRVVNRSSVLDSTRIGYQLLLRSELENAVAAQRPLTLFVIGVLRIQGSVTPELADEGIDKIRIFGSVKGPPAVLDRLADRIVRGTENLDH